MSDFQKLIYSEEVLEFVSISGRFCRLLEEKGVPETASFVREGLILLPRMYSLMISVPETEPVFDETNEKLVTEENWSQICQRLTAILGPGNDYLDIADDSEYDRSELISRTISEDLADIYQDIRDFLEIFRNSPEDIMNDALWECRMNFDSSWGKKVLRVCRALHDIYNRQGTDTENQRETGRDIDFAGKADTSEWFISKRQKEFGENEPLPE